MAQGQFRHLARPEDENGPARQVAEDLPCQLDGNRRDGDGHAGDAGLGPHALGDVERLLQQVIQDDPGGLLCPGNGIGRLDLPEDLGLAEDHGLQAGGDPEDVPGRGGGGVGVESAVELGRVQTAVPSQAGDHGLQRLRERTLGHPVHLDAIAGGEDHPLRQLRDLSQRIERLGKLALGKE